jgi:hypothetical protein
MVNFPCNPQLFIPVSLDVDHGWHRPARSRIALGGVTIRHHEQYAILELQSEL